jgi:hypothetical protein
MPQLRITTDTVVNRQVVRAGAVVACSEADARLLLRIGKAERINPAEAQAPALLKPAARRTDRGAPRTVHQREETP